MIDGRAGGAGGPVSELYGRALGLVAAGPLILLLPAAAELAQHAVEIGLGMYAPGGAAAAANHPQRLAFGAIKVLAILATVIFLVRIWAFGGDSRRAVRPTALLLKGLAIWLLVQIGGQLFTLLAGRGLGGLADADRAGRLALAVAPLLLWLFFANLLLPWFIGMIAEDRSMTAARSVAAVRNRLWATFGIWLAGFLPLTAVHYALGYGAIGQPAALVWAMMVVDALVVGLLAAAIASTYYTIYRRAARSEPAG